MTRAFHQYIQCDKCGNKIQASTPFSLWLRDLPKPLDSKNYDNQDLDYVWFSYRSGWFITIEEKIYSGYLTSAQSDTQNIVAQMLEASSGKFFRTMRGKRRIEYRGHYIIVFEKTTPDNGWIKINGQVVAKDDVLYLLRYGKLRVLTP